MSGQRLRSLIPKRSQPDGDHLERTFSQVVVALPPLLLLLDQPRLAQDAEVLGDRGATDLFKAASDRLHGERFPAQRLEDRASRRIGERLEYSVELFFGNHRFTK
jgi:hypothetical protein